MGTFSHHPMFIGFIQNSRDLRDILSIHQFSFKKRCPYPAIGVASGNLIVLQMVDLSFSAKVDQRLNTMEKHLRFFHSLTIFVAEITT